jgi:hypothetical protein
MRTLGAVLVFAELLHLFLVELVELVELLRSQDLGEGVHPVDAVFEQCLVGIEDEGFRSFDGCRVSAFERLP